MKLHHEHIELYPDSSFLFRHFRLPQFDGIYHNHPEFELTLIVKSTGQRCVGNHLAPFREGELVLLGPDLPHYWRNNRDAGKTKKHSAESIVVQFDPQFMGAHFFGQRELQTIAKLLHRSAAGLLFNKKVSEECALLLMDMQHQSAFDRLISLLQILQKLAVAKRTETLSAPLSVQPNYTDIERIDKVYQYINKHFKGTISLQEVAALVNMTPASFCRYFKKITKRTLFSIVSEHRIQHACHLLLQTELSIADICFECGYTVPAHFNEQFKKRHGTSPLRYKKAFMEKADG